MNLSTDNNHVLLIPLRRTAPASAPMRSRMTGEKPVRNLFPSLCVLVFLMGETFQ